eukprot:CFRG0844T1
MPEEAMSRDMAESRVWKDVTESFREHVGCLGIGEVLAPNYFNLREGMSALELMDMKMDAGMAFASDDNRILSVDDAIRREKVKLEGFTIEERVGIMDETFARLCTWLKGDNLAQTLYECVYLHRPGILIDRPLMVFFSGMERCIAMIHGIVQKSGIYHEEDFQLRDVKSQGGPVPMPVPSVESAITMLIISATHCIETPEQDRDGAVSGRLSFLAHFMMSLQTFSVGSNVTADYRITHKKLLDDAQEDLQTMLKTSAMSVSMKEEGGNLGYVPALAYRQLSSGPAVQVKIVERSDAIVYLQRLIERFRVASHIPRPEDGVGNGPLLVRVRRFLAAYNADPHTCTLSRSVVYCIVWCDRRLMGSVTLIDAMKEEINSFIPSPYLFHSKPQISQTRTHNTKSPNKPQANDNPYPSPIADTENDTVKSSRSYEDKDISEHETDVTAIVVVENNENLNLSRRLALAEVEADKFLNKLHQPMLNLLKIGCFNKAREHRVLAQKLKLMVDWQVDADASDIKINKILKGSTNTKDHTQEEKGPVVDSYEDGIARTREKDCEEIDQAPDGVHATTNVIVGEGDRASESESTDVSEDVSESQTFVSYLGSWVLSIKLEMMERYLTDTIRLDLFLPRELGMAYLYLDYIFGWQVSTRGIAIQARASAKVNSLERSTPTNTKIPSHADNLPSRIGKKTKKKKKPAKKNTANSAQSPHTQTPPPHAQATRSLPSSTPKQMQVKQAEAPKPLQTREAQIHEQALKQWASDQVVEGVLVEVKQALARAFARTFEGLRAAQRVKQPLKYFDREDLRYFHRFEPFMHLRNPEFLDFEYLKSNMSYNQYSADTIFQNAAKLFNLCTEHLSQMAISPDVKGRPRQPEIESLLKVAKLNAVVTRLLATGHKSPMEPTLDYTANREFPQLTFPKKND